MLGVRLPEDAVQARREADNARNSMTLADAIAEVRREREARHRTYRPTGKPARTHYWRDWWRMLRTGRQ